MHARPRLRVAFTSLAAAFVFGCLAPPGIRYPDLPKSEDGALHLISFDVGQADALLVIYRGKTLLIDAGSPLREPLRAARHIPRRLDALLGHRHLDYVMVSHYHQDHFGAPGGRSHQQQPSGLFALIEREGVTVGTLLDRGFWSMRKGASQRNYERAVADWLTLGRVSARRELHVGDTVDMGQGLTVRAVAASGNGRLDRLASLFPTFVADAPPSENDYSLGVKITLGDFEFFSAGDLSGRNLVREYGSRRESYNDIESAIAGEVGAVEAYRVNHHGSTHSSNPCFVSVLRPQVSVISSGPNHYGHPAIDVVERLSAHGRVFVTGGVDRQVAAAVGHLVVGDDVEIVVAPDGRRFWVNGAPFTAHNDADETTPGTPTHCEAREASPETFEVKTQDLSD